ncbi:hypothetical protein GCM10010349_34520 [Streptomyces flavofungini]|nr:hypothetical protein GCM10010349_34520 [Streptomyces flavofungini]
MSGSCLHAPAAIPGTTSCLPVNRLRRTGEGGPARAEGGAGSRAAGVGSRAAGAGGG